MNTDLLTSSFKPEAQLVIYKNDRHDAYVELMEYLDNGELSEGRPLTKKALKQLLNLVATTDKSTYATVNKLLPESVLYYDPRPGKMKLIWWNKPQIRAMHGINKKPIVAKVPAVIYLIDDDSLSMYVIKGSKRPDLKAQLFHPPFPNVYADAKVCMGSVKKPSNKVELEDLINGWEEAFWKSEFTDHLWDDKYFGMLRKAARMKTAFPSTQLKATKKTIKTLIN
jgi:PRTRC genetic system protein B